MSYPNNKKALVSYLLSIDKREETWYELAERFEISIGKSRRERSKAANDVWRSYLRLQKRKEKRNSNLETVKEVYHHGEIAWETKKLPVKDDKVIDIEGYEVVKITDNPYGGQWVTYKPKPEPLVDFDELRETLLKDIVPIHIEPQNTNEKALMLYTSDKHIGAHTKEDSMYSNVYNPKEFQRRMWDILKEIKTLSDEFGVFDSIYVLDLGDALDGYDGKTTRGGHELPQNLTSRGQYITYVDVHKQWFDVLVEMNVCNNIHFVCTSNSNHGGDFEYMAMTTVEMYLNMKYPQVKTTVNTKFMNHFSYGDHTFIYTHGKDTEDMRSGLPLSLNDKTEIYINDYIDYNNISGYIHVIKGDLHQSSTQFAKKFRYKNVLSLYGSSKWIHTNFGSGVAGVDYDIVDKQLPRILEGRLIVRKT